jgi:hypothetical protein
MDSLGSPVRIESARPLTWRLFQDVVTPAVLGNTLWAFFQLLAATDWHPTTTPRLLTLGLLALFFLLDWRGGDQAPAAKAGQTGAPWLCWVVFTSVFYLASAAVAIQVGTISRHAYVPMVALFAVTALGQFAGVWKREGDTAGNSWYVISNTVAAAAIVIGWIWQSLEWSGTLTNATDVVPHWIAFVAILGAMFPMLVRWWRRFVRRR